MFNLKLIYMQSLEKFYAERKIEAQSVVRLNKNDYPYITFINDDGEAENIYFGVEAGKKVSAGQHITDLPLDTMVVVETQNAEGETRLKLAFSSGEITASPFKK